MTYYIYILYTIYKLYVICSIKLMIYQYSNIFMIPLQNQASFSRSLFQASKINYHPRPHPGRVIH